jgi:FlaA1/EpsC-like NDP-sugar epimerase
MACPEFGAARLSCMGFVLDMLARGAAIILAATRLLAGRMVQADRRVKRLLAASADVVSCIVAVWLSFSIRLGYWQLATPPVLLVIGFELACFITIFSFTGVYNNVFRFHGPRGLAQLAFASLYVAVPTVLVFGLISVPGVPRTITVLFPLVFFSLVALSRIIARFVLIEFIGAPTARQRVLIYGAGQAGRQLASSLSYEPVYRLIGYIDEERELAGQRIEGIPIFAASELEALIDDLQIDIVLLALPNIGRSARAEIVERLQATGVHVQTLPAVRQIVDGKVSVSDLREIAVADLLGRDTVTPNPALLGRIITGKTVLVTGAGGSIGSELCRQILRQKPSRLVTFEMSEAALFAIDNELRTLADELGIAAEIVPTIGSLVDEAGTRRLFARFRPQTVFHAAAYKHVPLVEQNPVAGVRNNVLSTLHAAQAARASGVERFVLVSSDKAVRPANVMGASKRVCELILQALADEPGTTVFSMVRFGNVLGSSGSVVPHFERQIARGGPVTLTHREVTRFFMTIPEAAELVIQAGAMARGGEVYLLEMGEPVKIYDLARTMIHLAGLSVRDAANPSGDIAIVEVGLRPGEKLYEELLISAEARATDHPRIMMADEDKMPWSELQEALGSVRELLDAGAGDPIREMLRQLVSGYGNPPVDADDVRPPVAAPHYRFAPAGAGAVHGSPPVVPSRAG